jgi:hypothetical protein
VGDLKSAIVSRVKPRDDPGLFGLTFTGRIKVLLSEGHVDFGQGLVQPRHARRDGVGGSRSDVGHLDEVAQDVEKTVKRSGREAGRLFPTRL